MPNASPGSTLISSLPHRLVRASVLAGACWILSTPLTTLVGSAAAFAGCFLAAVWMDTQRQQSAVLKLRTPAFFIAAIVIVMLAGMLAGAFTGINLFARGFGALGAYQTAQIIFWFMLAASIGAILRLYARRYSWGSLPELLFVTCAFVITLAAHQRGMIDRPR